MRFMIYFPLLPLRDMYLYTNLLPLLGQIVCVLFTLMHMILLSFSEDKQPNQHIVKIKKTVVQLLKSYTMMLKIRLENMVSFINR